MYFTLETLQAKQGDCLILHFGQNDDPGFIVIDGGPGGVYNKYLKPRLNDIKNQLYPGKSLPLSMVMVSHMDDDHVNGILQLTGELVDAKELGDLLPYHVTNYWFNTFDDIINNIQLPAVSKIPSSASAADLSILAPQLASIDGHLAAVISSTGQGRKLRDNVKALGSIVNNPFKPFPSGGSNPVRCEPQNESLDWHGNLSIQVIHPTLQRLRELQKQWDMDLKKAKKKGDDSIIFATIAGKDTSPFNLASIVCLVEFGGKKILLTGDARDDDILEGLKSKGLLKDGETLHVDILKLPHHGSDRNMSTNFFRRITADHYVISGDGSYHNPDKSTLTMLEEATRGNDDFTVHFTNRSGKHELEAKLDEFLAEIKQSNRKFKTNFLAGDAGSMKIDLLDEIDY